MMAKSHRFEFVPQPIFCSFLVFCLLCVSCRYAKQTNIAVGRGDLKEMASQAEGKVGAMDGDIDWAKYGSNTLWTPEEVSRKDNPLNAVNFFGDSGGPLLSFTVSASSNRIAQRVVEAKNDGSWGAGLDSEITIAVVTATVNSIWSNKLVISHGTDRSVDKAEANEIAISFGDADAVRTHARIPRTHTHAVTECMLFRVGV